jgi:hypothetical protein
LSNPDHLKSLASLHTADPRSDNQAVLDIFQPGTDALVHHHTKVANIKLLSCVPEAVFVHFETAKNLYLYAWFVYRFYPVAEQHALTSLEFALRLRLRDPLPKKYWDKKTEPTLRPLLSYAIDIGAIKNEGFRQWRDHVERRARERYSRERQDEMVKGCLPEIEIDYTQAIPNDADRDWDYLPVLRRGLPDIRNTHAHGSTMLHNHVLGTLELVSEIINQLYETNAEPDKV